MSETRKIRQRIWTEERKAELARDYPDTPNSILAERFHVTAHALIAKANEMGLYKKGRKLSERKKPKKTESPATYHDWSWILKS